MLKNVIIIAAVAIGCLVAGFDRPATAQANRTFVSGIGSDSNPCSLGAPCRSFAQAISQTNAGGEIVALDSAGYGTVSITKAITITAPDGIEAGITTSSATIAITINAGPNDVVTLHGLTLEGGGIGTNGIVLGSAGPLNIEKCVVRNFTNVGIAIEPVSPAANANYTIIDTTLANNTTAGVFFAPASASLMPPAAVFLTLKHDVLSGNGDGFRHNPGVGTNYQGFSLATLIDVAALGNKANAFAIQGDHTNAPNAIGFLTLYRSQAAGSPVGLFVQDAEGAMSATLLACFIPYTFSGAGVLDTTGDNTTFGPGMGTLTPIQLR